MCVECAINIDAMESAVAQITHKYQGSNMRQAQRIASVGIDLPLFGRIPNRVVWCDIRSNRLSARVECLHEPLVHCHGTSPMSFMRSSFARGPYPLQNLKPYFIFLMTVKPSLQTP